MLSEGKLPPSKESREHVVWVDKGLVTITGGKLTTFRMLAQDALKAVKPFLTSVPKKNASGRIFSPVKHKSEKDYGIEKQMWRRLYGRYGENANILVKMAPSEDLKPIPGTPTLWAELPFAAKHEQVRHLSDLLLRRVRIGILTPQGGKAYLDRVQKICEPVLPWGKKRWKQERKMYLDLVRHAHSLPADPL